MCPGRNAKDTRRPWEMWVAKCLNLPMDVLLWSYLETKLRHSLKAGLAHAPPTITVCCSVGRCVFFEMCLQCSIFFAMSRGDGIKLAMITSQNLKSIPVPKRSQIAAKWWLRCPSCPQQLYLIDLQPGFQDCTLTTMHKTKNSLYQNVVSNRTWMHACWNGRQQEGAQNDCM